MRKHLKIPSWIYFIISLALCLYLWACTPPDTGQQLQQLSSKIEVNPTFLPEISPLSESISISEPLPKLENYPLYGATNKNKPNTINVEIYSSTEKSNPNFKEKDWLIEVAKAFNDKNITVEGKVVQVAIRSIPSGEAQRAIAAGGTSKPNAYTPSNALWLSMLEDRGIKPRIIAPQLLPNTPGLVLSDKAYQNLAATGEVNFDRLLDAILAGNLTIGYANPYASSTAINLLYSIFWRAANHHLDGKPLTVSDLNSQQVNSVFETFQKKVLVTTTTTFDLLQIYQRDPGKLDAFPLEYQNYLTLQKQPELKNLHFISFGIPHNNPLVTFNWNSPQTDAAIAKFTQFALSQKMQQLAAKDGFVPIDNRKTLSPPLPDGKVLLEAQKYWKQHKDLGRKVYMQLVVDVSGSMDGTPLASLKEALKVATGQINPGNEVGLISFADKPTRIVSLDILDPNRLLAGINSLQAFGNTAIYDALIVGLADLQTKQEQDPNGIFYLLLLTDGDRTEGLKFEQIQNILRESEVRIFPIAYGDVNEKELNAIAALRESTVKKGNPDNVKELMHQFFQTQL